MVRDVILNREAGMDYLDEDALTELAIAAVKMGSKESVTPDEIRVLVRQHIEQVRRAMAGPSGTAKAKCSQWVESLWRPG